MKKIEIFGKEIIVRDYICSSKKNETITTTPSLRLYLKVTDCCNEIVLKKSRTI